MRGLAREIPFTIRILVGESEESVEVHDASHLGERVRHRIGLSVDEDVHTRSRAQKEATSHGRLKVMTKEEPKQVTRLRSLLKAYDDGRITAGELEVKPLWDLLFKWLPTLRSGERAGMFQNSCFSGPTPEPVRAAIEIGPSHVWLDPCEGKAFEVPWSTTADTIQVLHALQEMFAEHLAPSLREDCPRDVYKGNDPKLVELMHNTKVSVETLRAVQGLTQWFLAFLVRQGKDWETAFQEVSKEYEIDPGFVKATWTKALGLWATFHDFSGVVPGDEPEGTHT